MVQQDVALVHGREQVGAVEQRGRLQWRVAQLGATGDFAQLHEQAQVERSIDSVDVVLRNLHLLTEQRHQFLRGAGLDLHADHVADAASAQLAFDAFDLRPPTLVVEVEFGVARKSD